MKKIELMIVDDNIEFVELVRSAVEEDTGIHIIATAYNGNEALAGIKKFKPDMVLLDVVMPEKDGLEVLEDISRFTGKKPIVIMLTAIGQDHYIRRALALGAEFYIIKPFDLTLLTKRIRQIYQDTSHSKAAGSHTTNEKSTSQTPATVNKEDVERETIKALNEVSVPPHLTGYLYLKRGIMTTVLSEKGFLPATKELYPSIAEEFGTSPGKIERAIRGAIQKAWTRKEQSEASQYFAYAGKYKSIKPTNSEFIATIASCIRQILHIEI